MSKLGKLDIVGLFAEHGAIMDGHFRLPSGMHSSNYIQTALVLQYPHIANRIAKAMASKFPQDVNCVCALAMGAVVIGQELARVKKCRAIFAERVGADMTLRRDFHVDRGERVLIVEDVLTTGRSTGEVIRLVGAYGAKVAGVASIVDRTISAPGFGVPFRSLISYPLQVYPQDNCDPCRRGVPVMSPGSKNPES